MKIIISDYPGVMETDYSLTREAVLSVLPQARIEILPYSEDPIFYKALSGAEGLITAFLPLDERFFSKARRLRCVSISAAGYGNVDLKSAQRHGVAICHIEEYCTREVAEHTLSLILALNRNLKYYTRKIEKDHEWKFHTVYGGRPLSQQTLSIFGFGRIGRMVAEYARALGMEVLAVAPGLKAEEALRLGVRPVTVEEALRKGDVITNHMNLKPENVRFFNREAFSKMERSPLFINTGRGGSVDEEALCEALDTGKIRGAGLDVLTDEDPSLEGHPLLGRDNVVITPHSAFYSSESMEKLQIISGSNLAFCLKGEMEKVRKPVSG